MIYLQFLKDNLHLMEKEYNFWINNRTIDVMSEKSKRTHSVAHYFVNTNTPR